MIGSNFPGFEFNKPTLPRYLEQRARKAARDRLDRQESDKARRRSGGRCEVVLRGERCQKRGGLQVHHMLRGVGKRAVGDSLLAEFKVHACADHHRDLDLYRILPSWTTLNPQDSLRFRKAA